MGFFQDVPATSGVTYTFSIWVKREPNYNEDYTELKMEWKDGNSVDLGGSLVTNISRQAGPTYTRFAFSGRTLNPACATVRLVVYTKWLTPTDTQLATMQFDDAALVAEPAALIMISQLPWLVPGISNEIQVCGVWSHNTDGLLE